MKKNIHHYELRIDARAIVTGDTRARRYAETLRRDIFESADEMVRYFCAAGDLEQFIRNIEA